MNSKDIFNNRYVLEKLLGSGAFAEVWLATDRQTGLQFALKIYAPATGLPDDGIQMLTHEFSIMANVSHQNLLTPKYYDIYNNCPFLILQYCSQGNIERHVGHFTEQQAWQLLRDAASGLAYLHAMHPPVLHQDIKPANILINDNGQFMLTDFGVSTKARASLSKATQGDAAFISAGTIPYMAPERFSSQNMPIMANDIYSLGVTTFEMLTGYLPFGEHGGLLQKNGADVPELPEGQFSQHLTYIIAQCMQKNPAVRPFATKLAHEAQEVLDRINNSTVYQWINDNKEQDKQQKTTEPQVQENDSESVVSPEPKTAPKRKVWLWCLQATIVIWAVVLAAITLWPKGTAESVTDRTQVKATMEQDTVAEFAVAKPAKSEKTTTANAPTNEKVSQSVTSKAIVTKVRSISNTPVQHETLEKAHQQVLNLGYATYAGEVKNGKPHGEGILTFKVDHLLDSYDDEHNIAKVGEQLEGTFYNGHLDYGTWHKHDGSTQTLVIGH